MFLDRQTRTEGLIYLEDRTAPVRRVDTYGILAKWFWQVPQEVEIWSLPDGRKIRATRTGQQDWHLTWRAA